MVENPRHDSCGTCGRKAAEPPCWRSLKLCSLWDWLELHIQWQIHNARQCQECGRWWRVLWSTSCWTEGAKTLRLCMAWRRRLTLPVTETKSAGQISFIAEVMLIRILAQKQKQCLIIWDQLTSSSGAKKTVLPVDAAGISLSRCLYCSLIKI